MDVYINDVAALLPNEPVTNDQLSDLPDGWHSIVRSQSEMLIGIVFDSGDCYSLGGGLSLLLQDIEDCSSFDELEVRWSKLNLSSAQGSLTARDLIEILSNMQYFHAV